MGTSLVQRLSSTAGYPPCRSAVGSPQNWNLVSRPVLRIHCLMLAASRIMHSWRSNFFAGLAASPVFLIFFLTAGTAITGFSAGLLAGRAGVGIGLIFTGIAAFAATHFAYGSRSLEIHLFTGLSILLALMLVHYSSWWVALPGAAAGCMGCLALSRAMDGPNKRSAAEEQGRKHETGPKDES